MRKANFVVGILLGLLAAPCLMFCQSNGSAQIAGIITDPTGAVIPSAQIKAVQADTGQARDAVSSATGTYVLPNLPVGPYRLEVTGAGFERYINTGIILEVGNQVTVNVSLRLGDTSQSVQVAADAAMV